MFEKKVVYRDWSAISQIDPSRYPDAFRMVVFSQNMDELERLQSEFPACFRDQPLSGPEKFPLSELRDLTYLYWSGQGHQQAAASRKSKIACTSLCRRHSIPVVVEWFWRERENTAGLPRIFAVQLEGRFFLQGLTVRYGGLECLVVGLATVQFDELEVPLKSDQITHLALAPAECFNLKR